MPGRFHVTYDIVTPESAEHADASERGFVLADGSRVELPADCFGEAAGKVKAECALTLREAVNLMGVLDSPGDMSSYYEADGHQDYRTGAEERRALHLPDSVTVASAFRVARILAARRLLAARDFAHLEQARANFAEWLEG